MEEGECGAKDGGAGDGVEEGGGLGIMENLYGWDSRILKLNRFRIFS